MVAYLDLQDIVKQYGEAPPAVAGFNLAVARGEFITILGPSGCGKTTVLRMLAGLVPPSAGRIVLDGQDITARPAHLRRMGLVFQNYALFPHLTVARNVAFGLAMRGIRGRLAGERVRDGLELVRLGGLQRRMPKELSGGQQQRVALARALVIEPAVLLLDEPLSNLDAKLREELRAEIRDIQQRLGMTAVFVTHDQAEALTMSDRVAVMQAGRLEQVGTPTEIYERPATPFVAGFIGRTNKVAATVEAASSSGSTLVAGGLRFTAPRVLPRGTRVTAMIRPHRMRVSKVPASAASDSNDVSATVRRVVFAGETIQYELDAAGTVLLVESQTVSHAGSSPAPGDAVHVAWSPADTLVFETA